MRTRPPAPPLSPVEAAVVARFDAAPELPESWAGQQQADPLWTAHNVTDRQWHMLTGACGGCGSANCHPGPCPQNSNGYCLACQTRRDTGETR